MFSTDFIFRQQENLVDNQKCQAGFRLLCNKILLYTETTCITRMGVTILCCTYLADDLLKQPSPPKGTIDWLGG